MQELKAPGSGITTKPESSETGHVMSDRSGKWEESRILLGWCLKIPPTSGGPSGAKPRKTTFPFRFPQRAFSGECSRFYFGACLVSRRFPEVRCLVVLCHRIMSKHKLLKTDRVLQAGFR